MSFYKKITALFLTLSLILVTALPAADYVYDAGGCGYQQCRKAPCIAPAIALGTIALVAIIAVAVQDQGCSNDHGHGHCACN